MNPSAISKAMIFAAGLGTRFKPWTDSHPKALAPVNGKSLLQRNIEYLQGFGIHDVVVNVHHFADQVVAALSAADGWGSRFTISDETDEVLETGGGLKKARRLLEDGPFVVMNVDILTDMDLGKMIAAHMAHRPLATLAVSTRDTSRYFLFDASLRLRGWRNVKTGQERWVAGAAADNVGGAAGSAGDTAGSAGDTAGSAGEMAGGAGLRQMAFSGIHIIDPSIFPIIRQEGKFSMVDVYLDLGGAHLVRGYDHSGAKLIDVGKPASAEQAAKMFL